MNETDPRKLGLHTFLLLACHNWLHLYSTFLLRFYTYWVGMGNQLIHHLSVLLPKEIVGEDSTSVDVHVNVATKWVPTHPDVSIVRDRMARTFSWRRSEISEGMPVEDVLNKYPHLRTPTGVSTVKTPECYMVALSCYVIILDGVREIWRHVNCRHRKQVK